MKAVRYTRRASRSLLRLPAPTARRIDEKLRQYADDPAALANNVKRLKGGDGLLRLRMGDWRIVFCETESRITVLLIASRGDVYR